MIALYNLISNYYSWDLSGLKRYFTESISGWWWWSSSVGAIFPNICKKIKNVPNHHQPVFESISRKKWPGCQRPHCSVEIVQAFDTSLRRRSSLLRLDLILCMLAAGGWPPAAKKTRFCCCCRSICCCRSLCCCLSSSFCFHLCIDFKLFSLDLFELCVAGSPCAR